MEVTRVMTSSYLREKEREREREKAVHSEKNGNLNLESIGSISSGSRGVR